MIETDALQTNVVGDEGVAALAEALKHNSSVTELRLRVRTQLWYFSGIADTTAQNNCFGDYGARALAQALEHNISVRPSTLLYERNCNAGLLFCLTDGGSM